MDQLKTIPISNIIILIVGVIAQQNYLLNTVMVCCYKLVTLRRRYARKYSKFLTVQPLKEGPRRPRKVPARAEYSSTLSTEEWRDLPKRCGIDATQFKEFLELVRPDLEKPRSGKKQNRTALSPAHRLMLALHWIRKYLDYHSLGLIYGISESSICREIKYLLPILYSRLNYMRPLSNGQPQMKGCIGIIDCTPHMRDRVHPRSLDYYRGDKKYYFLTTQAITHLNGDLADVVVALGHNNDQALFKISHTNEYLEKNRLNLLADRGYTHHRLINNSFDIWDDTCASSRVVVENVFALVKKFKALRCRFVQGPEMQACTIIVGFEMAANTLKYYPLRCGPVIAQNKN